MRLQLQLNILFRLFNLKASTCQSALLLLWCCLASTGPNPVPKIPIASPGPRQGLVTFMKLEILFPLLVKATNQRGVFAPHPALSERGSELRVWLNRNMPWSMPSSATSVLAASGGAARVVLRVQSLCSRGSESIMFRARRTSNHKATITGHSQGSDK